MKKDMALNKEAVSILKEIEGMNEAHAFVISNPPYQDLYFERYGLINEKIVVAQISSISEDCMYNPAITIICIDGEYYVYDYEKTLDGHYELYIEDDEIMNLRSYLETKKFLETRWLNTIKRQRFLNKSSVSIKINGKNA